MNYKKFEKYLTARKGIIGIPEIQEDFKCSYKAAKDAADRAAADNLLTYICGGLYEINKNAPSYKKAANDFYVMYSQTVLELKKQELIRRMADNMNSENEDVEETGWFFKDGDNDHGIKPYRGLSGNCYVFGENVLHRIDSAPSNDGSGGGEADYDEVKRRLLVKELMRAEGEKLKKKEEPCPRAAAVLSDDRAVKTIKIINPLEDLINVLKNIAKEAGG